MPRLIAPAFAAMLASAGVPAEAGVQVTADPECRVVRYLSNGRRIERPPTRGAHHRPAGLSAHVTSSAPGAAAGVSVSSSSRGSGHATATASSSSGPRGRSVTTTHDENGCTVVIDDRARGARR